jgi:hypothetical protein
MPEMQAELLAAAKELSMMLRESAVRPFVVRLFDAVRSAYPETRESLRRAVALVAHGERKYWKQLSTEDLAEIDRLHARFEDTSLTARLHQHVGQPQWEKDEQPDLQQLARDLLASTDALEKAWPWLTSGDAADAWRLGEALAAVDGAKALAVTLPSLPGTGPDLRALCGYICTCRRELGDDWFDKWVSSQLQREPKPINLLFEVAFRCGATISVARLIAQVLGSEIVRPEIVGQLVFGRWGEELPPDVLEEVLRAMIAAGHAATAVAILERRMKAATDERERWRPLALGLATTSELIRSGLMTNFYWKELATSLVSDHPGEIAAAIMREQGNRSAGTWFAEHSEAAHVLHACVENNPRAVWTALLPQLKSRADAYMFTIGFPRGLPDKVPAEDVIAWIEENPNERAPMVAKLASKNLSTDETLAARVLGAYGDIDDVASAFFGEYLSGGFFGPSSEHWEGLAKALDEVSSRTKLPKLRRWATGAAHNLRQMAERDRQREAEEEIRRH